MPAPSDLVHEISSSTGTGNFTLVNVNGKRSFNTAFGTGGTNVFDYFISNRDAGEWERGTGHLSAASTLVRDTVQASSNSGSAVNFSAGTKDVVNDVPAARQIWFNAGVSMLFFNSTAPAGWTKQTTHNDKAIRLVTGAPSTGGTVAFSTVFGKTATDATTITTTTMPSHNHGGVIVSGNGSAPLSISCCGISVIGSLNGGGTGFSGSGGSHTHGMDIRVQYVDAIICNKD